MGFRALYRIREAGFLAVTMAIMLACAYVLADEGLADREFLDRYCTGYEMFEQYLLG